MLSLKKAAAVENGWSFSEMAITRRVDEMRFLHQENGNRTRPSLDGDRASKGFRTPRADDLDQAPANLPEEIVMVVTNGSEKPSDPMTI